MSKVLSPKALVNKKTRIEDTKGYVIYHSQFSSCSSSFFLETCGSKLTVLKTHTIPNRLNSSSVVQVVLYFEMIYFLKYYLNNNYNNTLRLIFYCFHKGPKINHIQFHKTSVMSHHKNISTSLVFLLKSFLFRTTFLSFVCELLKIVNLWIKNFQWKNFDKKTFKR